ncbi:MAG: hypothetical protein JHC41_02725 [Nitrosopumilus sp.]|jgi:hypothetical protein|nr:hypothetical protein [Nitrosopumilus sp.]
MMNEIANMLAQKAGISPSIVNAVLPIVTKLLLQKSSPNQASGLLSMLPADITNIFSDKEKQEFTTTQQDHTTDEIIDKVDKEAGINDKIKSKNVVQEIMNMFQNTTDQKDLLGGFLGQATKKMDLNPFD